MEKVRDSILGVVVILWMVFITANCFGEEIEGKSDDAVSNDLKSAQEKYEGVLDRILYDTTPKEKQLDFNKSKIKELETQLKVRQEFLSRLPKEASKKYTEMKKTMKGIDEKTFNESAQKLGDDYEAITEQTQKEIAELQADLVSARQRQFTLEPEIKVTNLRKELSEGEFAIGDESDSEKEKKETGLEKLEKISSEAMEQEINSLEKLDVQSVQLDESFKTSLFRGR